MKHLSLTPFSKPVKAVVSVPGSKSITNRALILASLCKNPVEINNPLKSDDTDALISCLQTLGIKIKQEKKKVIVVGNITDIKNKLHHLDTKLSGTTMRFLLALCCIVPGEKILTGDKPLRKRPVKDLVDVLRQLGARIEYLESEGFPPVKILGSIYSSSETRSFTPQRMQSSHVVRTIKINGTISSQFLSALLLIAPVVGDVAINVEGELVSASYVTLTTQVMQSFNVEVIQEKNTFRTHGTYTAKKFIVEGDYSAACYFAAIAAITRSQITIKNLNPNSSQGDKEFFSILESMGNKIIKSANGITVIGKQIKPVTVNMEGCPDQIQTLSVLAAFGKGATKISGISTLTVKETDRLSAIITELEKMGIHAAVEGDTLSIMGGNPHGAIINTYGDHRMAMAFAIAGAALEGMVINNPEVVSKTFPDFWKAVKKIGVGIHERKKDNRKIVLTGFMGAGKSSIAPLLAKKLGFKIIEMDQLVLQTSKKKSIKEIFEKHGEKKFREFERAVAKMLVNKKNVVISSGGGVIMNNQTMNILRDKGVVVFLATDFSTIEKRLIDTTDRPLLKNKEHTRKLFDLRQPLYMQHADITVSTDGKSLGKITEEILERITNV